MKPLSQQSLYEILDVPCDANPAVIAEAVERASALFGPGSLATYSLMAPDEEQLMTRRLEEARTTLLDPTARARYDERLTKGEGGAEPAAAPIGTPPPVDPALRAAWPELPPVVPAVEDPADSDWSEEDSEMGQVPTATPAIVRSAATPPPERPLPPVIPALVAEPSRSVPAPVAEPSRPAPTPIAEAPRPEPIRAAEPAPVATPVPVPLATLAPINARPILLSREVQAAGSAPTPTAPAPAVVPDGTTWSGEVLRKLREARGLSLQQISERTKVTRHHIENIEGDRYEALPAAVYLRGILLSIARELRLDGQKVARSYLERVAAATSVTTPVQRPR